MWLRVAVYHIHHALTFGRNPLGTLHHIVGAELWHCVGGIVTLGHKLAHILAADKHIVLLLAELHEVLEVFGLVFACLVDPKQTGVYPAELRAVEEALHVLIAEVAQTDVGVGAVGVGSSEHAVAVDERIEGHNLARGRVWRVDGEKDVEHGDVALGVFFREDYVAGAEMVGTHIVDYAFILLVPKLAAALSVGVVVGIAGIGRGCCNLVDI